MIGPRQGIAYTTDGAVTATHMTEFSHVQSIQTVETSLGIFVEKYRPLREKIAKCLVHTALHTQSWSYLQTVTARW